MSIAQAMTQTSGMTATSVMEARASYTGNPMDYCTESTCPVSVSIYGYRPNLPANAAGLILFAASYFAFLIAGMIWKRKVLSFTIVMCLGTLGEIIGYVGRLMLHNNVFNKKGFQIQIICLTVSPAFISAGLYFTLKHIVIAFGTRCSRLRPAWYTYIFITSDVISILLQAAGGAIAAAATTQQHQDFGNHLMQAGVIFQVVTLTVFAGLALDYLIRTRRAHKGSSSAANDAQPAAAALAHSTKFRLFLAALAVAFLAIYVRCVYRIVEMSGGWHSALMDDEALFIVLDEVMMLIAVLLLNVFHPGLCFMVPGERANALAEVKSVADSSDDEWSYRPRGPTVYPRPSRPTFQPRQTN